MNLTQHKNTIQWLAPAKLNLFLHITSQRADGYHCLQTIFQFIDYNDTLYFDVRNDEQLSCEYDAINLSPNQDLVLRAARLLKQYSGTSLGVDIRVEKKIPMGGGLGGGSSDAATTLLALNYLWQLQLSDATLAQLGLSLGADVPVFVQGHTAWAEGVGESLTPIDIEEPWYLVIHPGCHVSTAEIFLAKGLTRNTLPITMTDFLANQSKNVCEAVVRSQYPQIGQAIDWLSHFSPARLTGTGACLFAPFKNQTLAESVLAKLPKQWNGFVARGKNISPALKPFTNT
ncbi:4-(cytidine 5'-diphospho)-2-C-methyl-D-erythritol kinase [Candidatus Parabeggiatoa sp. HSG14]|uniref:4-(cytidine 5'-diphospho)-2-C-methyl-D-erythritol kinase n=1 Tax=Candidatus Parabeggiatoa sp. HSG14 TaxID=3055593 RepID=UPI0025A7010C|nr:4-(cytidine 5'-diphospho)-2-C-methyl-D-erythritol kinase [Thiotrichales bacterium HSG14]